MQGILRENMDPGKPTTQREFIKTVFPVFRNRPMDWLGKQIPLP